MTHHPLVYRMIMALNAADIGEPICDQAASICAEIADQYCAELHRGVPAPPVVRQASTEPQIALTPQPGRT